MEDIQRIKELTEILNVYRDNYYNQSKSLISDKEYDDMFDELFSLEDKTGIRMAASPTQNVGYEVKSKLIKVKHSHPMLSLSKTKSVEDLKSFAGEKDCLLMCKMDGLTVLLSYEDGKLIKAETRGDGEEGEDILHNAKAIKNIPLVINYPGYLEVEGEAIITYADFDIINESMPDDEKYKNPRNLASGSIRQLDSNIASKRNVKFVAWKVPLIENQISDEYFLSRLKYVESLGFDIVPFWTYTNKSSDQENIENMITSLKQQAYSNGYPIDGLVMTYNNIEYGNSLGNTGHHPKHSIAFKFYDEEVETVLRNIEWSMGKTGDLTPVAIFDSVEIDGTDVGRASLHNISICKELRLGIGDIVTVYKANAIIPQVKRNLTQSNMLEIPSICPVCGSSTKIVKDNNTEVLRCTNSDCKGKLLGKLSHAVSKNALNIDGLSESTIERFVELDWLKSISDIYKLEQYMGQMRRLDGFGKKSVDKLFEAIEKSKNTTLSRFIYSLSIPQIGRTASKAIEKYYKGDFVSFIDDTECMDWTRLNDFGNVMDYELNHFFLEHKEEVIGLAEEFVFDKEETNVSSNVLNGKSFCITGKLNHFVNRDELIADIEKKGGVFVSGVSAKTNYLINNDNLSPSSKNKKAQSLNVPIIAEEEYVKMSS